VGFGAVWEAPACHAVDTQSPAADELAIQAKIYGSETAVRVITDLMRVVGIGGKSYLAPPRNA
jgi:nitroalkane oxidase